MAAAALVLAVHPIYFASIDILPPGHRPIPPGVHALVGGTVVAKPGEVIVGGTVLIRDGFIEGVGKDIAVPADARVWEMKGLTIYAGFMDPYLTLGTPTPPAKTTQSEPIAEAGDLLTAGGIQFFGVPGAEVDPGNTGPGSEISLITPELRMAEKYAPSAKLLEGLHQLGFTSANVIPEKGIVRGTSVFVALSEANPNSVIIKAEVFQHVAFAAESVASLPEGERQNPYPRSLMGVIAAVRQTFFDADFYARDHADYRQNPVGRKRPEFNPSREALGPAVAKKMPVVIEAGSALMVDRAARVARELGLNFHLVSSGQEWRRPDLAKTTQAAFIVPLDFPEMPKLPEEDDWSQVTLDQLRAWDWFPENPAVLRREGLEVAVTTFGLSDRKQFRKKLRLALDAGFSEDDALAALTTVPAKLCGLEKQLGSIEKGKIANLTVVSGSYFVPENRVREVWIDGRMYPLKPPSEPALIAGEKAPEVKTPVAPQELELIKPKPPKPESEKSESDKKAQTETSAATPQPDLKLTDEERELRRKRVARSPLEGRGVLAEAPAVLVRGGTIWTSGPKGRLENADFLVVGGKIVAVGGKLEMPEEQRETGVTIDAANYHITPGLIDVHSHSMILGAVNEGTIPSTAMVRIGDVVNSETPNIYWQLAGGLTTASLLHGSANPIGGQNAIIKLRDGASPEMLKFDGAPPGIKFALGENVKQSNWGDRNVTRFPQSRMGVQTFLANRFAAARRYLKEKRQAEARPVRRDLELEALGEILEGQRWIHCHSYRQDEILAFLRLMESFGIKVGTLQHVLEGYKVADEIAKHGAGASAFADWWAYKFEVFDAIPYAGSLMRDRGALVSFNSDSSDHARRMNLEAAKAVKYGGTPEIDALNFVTINPAKQLRIDQRVGSLESGKDADFVLWSKSPLAFDTVCLQTWIDGKKYFDREKADERAAALEKERRELIDHAKKVIQRTKSKDSDDPGSEEKFFRVCLEHEFDGQDRHCLDDEDHQ
ncbi:MAG: amidohydrolase family protein [Verrucomicrobiales bacterium]